MVVILVRLFFGSALAVGVLLFTHPQWFQDIAVNYSEVSVPSKDSIISKESCPVVSNCPPPATDAIRVDIVRALDNANVRITSIFY
jgi:hypothetical protein